MTMMATRTQQQTVSDMRKTSQCTLSRPAAWKSTELSLEDGKHRADEQREPGPHNVHSSPSSMRGGSVGCRSWLQKSVWQHSMVRRVWARGESCIVMGEGLQSGTCGTGTLSRDRTSDDKLVPSEKALRPWKALPIATPPHTLHWKWEPSYFMHPELRMTSPCSSTSMMAKHWPLVLQAWRKAETHSDRRLSASNTSEVYKVFSIPSQGHNYSTDMGGGDVQMRALTQHFLKCIFHNSIMAVQSEGRQSLIVLSPMKIALNNNNSNGNNNSNNNSKDIFPVNC